MFKYKLISLLIFVAAGFLTTNSVAQEVNFELLTKIIKSGNSKDLVKQFSKTVELNIDGEEASYSQAQAEAILKDFFGGNAPIAFTINHKGSSKGGLPYAIGEYKNESGTYRVWIRLKPESGRNQVYEMSFIKESN
jgi:hypothetical protein